MKLSKKKKLMNKFNNASTKINQLYIMNLNFELQTIL